MARRDPSASTSQTDVNPLRCWTNRHFYIDRFRSLVRTGSGNGFQVLAFNGVGGEGKTLLLKKFQDVLTKEFPKVPYAYYNFDNLCDPTQAWKEVLLHFASHLKEEFDVDLPHFELCAALIQHRFGGSRVEVSKMSPLTRGLWEVVNGTSAGLGGILAERIAKWSKSNPTFEAWLRWAGGTEEVTRLERMDDERLKEEFVELFMANLAARKDDRQAAGVCKAVLFIDTYEALWTGRETGACAQARLLDGWVRKLAAYALGSGILLVVAGRDHLYWEEDEPQDGWERDLEQHRIGGFSRPDAFLFLSARGLVGQGDPLDEAIVACCKTEVATKTEKEETEESYHPLYLELCAETCLNHRAATGVWPNPDQFQNIPSAGMAKALSTRFLKSLDSGSMEFWLKELSLTPRFNEGVALALDAERSHHNGRAGWQRLLRFSFVEPGSGGFFRLHQTLRAVLQEELHKDQRRATLEWFRTRWSSEPGMRQEPGLEFYHRWRLDPIDTARLWDKQFDDCLRKLRVPAARLMLSLWEEVGLDQGTGSVVGKEALAFSQCVLARAQQSLPSAPRSEILSAAIQGYLASLRVYTEQDFPQLWAMTQNNLGAAYGDLPTGDRAKNLEQAIGCYQAALRVRTEQDFPQDWAMTQNNLGAAYGDLPTGDRAKNLEQAIGCYQAALRVRTEQDFPQDWAMTQNNLGLAYGDLPTGDRAKNLEQAIGCYQAALRVRTEQDFPQDWAMTQNNLGIAYLYLPTGDRAKNLEQAIGCYQAALRVLTEQDFPQDWAMTQNNLGIAYLYLPTGDRAKNLEQAIGCYQAALRVRTEQDFPQDWAMTQNNLGAAYDDLPTGDRAKNLEQAIGCYQAALRVRTEQDFPQQWAMTQYNLGLAKVKQAKLSEPAEALRRLQDAVNSFRNTLRVWTPESFPQDYSDASANLKQAEAEIQRIVGDRK